MTQRVHRYQRSVARLIAVVIREAPSCELGAGARLHRYVAGGGTVAESVAEEGEDHPAEVGSAAEAGDHHIRLLSCQLHLSLSLQPDDCLVESHMIHHRPKEVLGIGRGACQLYRLRDRHTEGTGVVGVSRQHILPRPSAHTWRRSELSAVDLHHRAARGLLLVAHTDLRDGTLQPEDPTCQ